MWGKTQLLRMGVIVLLVISLVLLSYGMLRYALQLQVFKLRAVQFTNTPQQVDLNQLNQVVRNSVTGSFFTLDLEQTRRAFEQLPWVRKVSVRRHFPWSIEVTLEEHVPMARWSKTELVNTFGEVFEGRSTQLLPEFAGPADTSIQIAQMYTALGSQLAMLQKRIVQINLSPRFAWQLRLDDGMLLELGREQMLQRVARFVAVYPYSLATAAHKANYVDLRYRNGFAANQLGSVSGSAVMKFDAKRNLKSKG